MWIDRKATLIWSPDPLFEASEYRFNPNLGFLGWGDKLIVALVLLFGKLEDL